MSKKTNTDATAFKKSKIDEIFNLVKKDGKINILVGNFKISNKVFSTWEEADKYIFSKPYELIINLSVLFSKLAQDEKEQNTKETAEKSESCK